MNWIDIVIFCVYFLLLLGIGFYFSTKNKTEEDYYIAGGKIKSGYVGLSVVATDVGGGFSIGLGGVGFTMGLSGSWLLFTGLIGAWLSAVFLIPLVYKWQKKRGSHFLTMPQVFGFLYNRKVAIVAAIIVIIGYTGFTSSQLLAGAKLTSATFPTISLGTMLFIMGAIAVIYTMLGGIKAVIYTDVVQWIVLLAGLMLVAIPLSYNALGGYEGIAPYLSKDMLSLTQNLTWQLVVNWSVTIIPIWFVGMTLYQRIFACRSEKAAQRAWYFAGILEWPFMAFTGVILGMLANVAVQKGIVPVEGGVLLDSEMGLPLLIKNILPVGFTGVVMAAYFSAVLSTADSCLMAASGSFVGDLIPESKKNEKTIVRFSQISTLVIGGLAILLASTMENVLSLMLYAYAFMVSGLLVPIVAAMFLKERFPLAALLSMITGGGVTVILIIGGFTLPYGLDANVFGLSASAIIYTITHIVLKQTRKSKPKSSD
ncbi:MAG TPA: sodium:solute symporter family protein [Edaphocola sp.]|nr:sodium:solute symporter family protein [Edaphocola sp.]